MIRIKNPQDFWSGVLFALLGAAALWFGRNYAYGTVMRMGPGFLPAVLGIGLILVGGLLLVRALAVSGAAIDKPQLRPQLFLIASIVAFALLIERAGLIAAASAVAVLASFASREMRWFEVILLAIGVSAASVALFIYLLGQPMDAWSFR